MLEQRVHISPEKSKTKEESEWSVNLKNLFVKYFSHLRLETLQKQREMMQQELKKSTQKTLSSEERAQNMDQILANEESRVTIMEKELATLRDKQFKHAQEVFELKQKDTIMQAEIQGSRAALRNLSSKQQKLDEEALKQLEILYTQDFQLQQLQHKLSRLDGERTDDEKNALSSRIKVSSRNLYDYLLCLYVYLSHTYLHTAVRT